MERGAVARSGVRRLWSGVAVLVLGGVVVLGLGLAGRSQSTSGPQLVVSGSQVAPSGCTTTYSITGPGASTSSSAEVAAARDALASTEVAALDLVVARELIVSEGRYEDFEAMDDEQQALLVRHEAVAEAVSGAMVARGFGSEGYELQAGSSC
jgi:hypothetical protein